MKKVLMVWGGWEGHEPAQCTARFVPFLKEQEFEVTLSERLSVFADEEALLTYDLIVPCWTMGVLSEEEERALLNAVARGTGIAGWHGGMGDAFRTNTAFQFMVGGQFVEHPGGIIPYTVHIDRPQDPVMEGIRDFQMRSECYYMHVDPSNEVLAHTVLTGDVYPWIQGCVMPVVWKRPYGAGRVFYSALGHVAADFDVPQCFDIMKRGMLWAARRSALKEE
ncbi:MAG: ThuA domain-containing protein [Candidatus Hydrogenedentes bacterium]|jgi:type 1 glutamine amidotransferase|nr:ThuA domain-containing protein [Candidatus Hydrogenedentota bacterium]